jgi:hypothetical protein
MAEQSQFSRLPKKQLVFIAEKLVDADFPIGNPYISSFDSSYETLQQVSKYFSIESTHEDIEFFAKFLEINGDIIAELFANNKEQMNNRELIEQLVIPVAKSYNLDYDIKGTCSYTEYLTQEFDCYDSDWVVESAEQQRQDGNWDMWGGGTERSRTDYDDYEPDDFEYVDVYEVESDEPQKESILHRLVIENTSDVVNSLDKKTLLELRWIIDSKLRLL